MRFASGSYRNFYEYSSEDVALFTRSANVLSLWAAAFPISFSSFCSEDCCTCAGLKPNTGDLRF